MENISTTGTRLVVLVLLQLFLSVAEIGKKIHLFILFTLFKEFDFLHFSHNQNSKAKYAQESHAQFAKHKEKIRYDQSCLRLLENHYHQQLNFNVSNYQQRFVNNNFYEKNYVNQYSIKCLQFIQIWWKYLVVSKINKKKDKGKLKCFN